MPKLSIIIPCYYNEKNIPETTKVLIANEQQFPADLAFEYVMVDDGSKDGTFAALKQFQTDYPKKVKVIRLAKNVGSHYAVLAGMNYSTGDCCVILAADLQDPPELIPKMYHYWVQGFKLVLANRENREDRLLQRLLASLYHRLIRRLALPNSPPGGFDLLLFDQQLKKHIVEMNEKNTHLTYLITWLGFDYVNIPYTRQKRQIGKSRWTLRKKIKLFVDSFVSFSFFPIRMISFLGFLLGFIALLYGLVVIISRLVNAVPVEGWSSLMVVLLFVSSFQMIALGIIGEYVWRSLDASRKRPNFIVDEVIADEDNKMSNE